MDIDLDREREYLVETRFIYWPDFHTSLANDDISLILRIRKDTKASIHFILLANNNKKRYAYQLLSEFCIRSTTLQKMTKESLCKRVLDKLVATEFCAKELYL